MDVPNPDDKMEVGTSPFPHVEDIDFDLDPVREQSMDRSMADESEAVGKSVDDAGNSVNFYGNDDDMIEDEMLQDQYTGEATDMSMETYIQHDSSAQDEEILYDYEATGSLEMTNTQDEELEQLETESYEEPGMVSEETGDKTQELNSNDQNDGITKVDSTTVATDNQVSGFDDEVTNPVVDDFDNNVQDNVAAETKVLDFAVEEAAAEDAEKGTAQDATATTAESASTFATEELSESNAIHRGGASSQQEPSQSDRKSQEQQPVQIEPAIAQDSAAESSAYNQPSLIAEAPGSLHPVTISYLGQDMSLFPPMVSDTSATFFLSDSTLAYEPFGKLLVACREILGDSLEHDDELVLDIPALGLHICEDSKYSSQLNLSQVIDVFLSLSHNEKVDNPEPIYCNLSSRVCLASQYAYLSSSAQEGKTFTEITAECLDSPAADVSSYQELPTDNENQVVHGTEVATNAGAPLETEAVRVDHGAAQDDPDTSSHTSPDEPRESTDQTATTQEDESADLLESSETINGLQPFQEQRNVANAEASAESEHAHDDQAWLETTETDVQAPDEDDQFDEVTVEHENASNSSHTVENESPGRLNIENHEENELDNLEDDINQEDYQHGSTETDTYDFQDEVFHESGDGENNVSFEAPEDDNVANFAEVEDAANLINEDLDEHEYFDENDETVVHDPAPEEPDEVDDLESIGENDQPEAVSEPAFLDVDQAGLNAPVTPSKQNGSKRKVLEEDEDLDFLDFSTPEPKRNRAS